MAVVTETAFGRYGAVLVTITSFLGFVCLTADPAASFVVTRSSSTITAVTRRSPVSGCNSARRHRLVVFSVDKNKPNADDNDSAAENNNESSSSSSPWCDGLLESLRARQLELAHQEQILAQRWKTADCESGVAAILPDWVRRLSVDYPLAACGSASGTIYVTHLERHGKVIAQSTRTNCDPAAANVQDEEEEEALKKPEDLAAMLRLLYGSYDGGGTIAIAFSGTLICEAGRSGGVNIWRLDRPSKQLIAQGSIPALEGILVTSLILSNVDNDDDDDEYLWVATADGRVQGYSLGSSNDEYDDDEDDDDDYVLPLALRMQPDKSWQVSAPVVSMQVNSDLACAVVTTASGSVELISLRDNDETAGRPFGSFLPPFDSSRRRSSHAYAVCATIVQHTNDNDNSDTKTNSQIPSYSIVCGGNDGSLFLQPLELLHSSSINSNNHQYGGAGNYDNVLVVDTKRPFQRRLVSLTPRHMEAVRVLASPAPGLLISGGMDGSMRVWDIGSHSSSSSSKRQGNDSGQKSSSSNDDKSSSDSVGGSPQCLYQFVGYKVWLGSLWTDGRRIVSDGADNTVILHNYDFANTANKNNKLPPTSNEEDDDNKNNGNKS